jgi:3-deoxy-D-manno-octulosonate 8-phosphate phosphatase (KDO 8-P phosphatase)
VAVFEGIRDKEAELPRLLELTEREAGEIAYIGDDVNDLGILCAIGRAGLTAAPADAVATVSARAHLACRSRGGEGAFREFADWILRLRTEPESNGEGRAS